MPRDNDKDNNSRGRRDRPSGGKGRSGVPRGPDKKFAKRGFAGKAEGERRPYAGKRDDRPPRRDDRDAPRPRGDRPFADRPSRGGEGEKRSFRPRDDRGGDKRPYTPRGDRPDRDARPAARFQDRKFGDKKPYTPREGGEKRPYTPRGEGFRKDNDRPRGDRPFNARPRDGDRPRGDRPFAGRPERKFDGDKKFSRGPAQGFRRSSGSRQGIWPRPWRCQTVAEARGRRRIARTQLASRPRRCAEFRSSEVRQAALRQAAQGSRSGDRYARGFRVHVKIARKAIVRFANVRNSTVPRGSSEVRPPAPGSATANSSGPRRPHRLAGASPQRTTRPGFRSSPPGK